MVEALGIAAGAVGIASFCIQIVEQGSKLKSFLKSLKGAPQELEYLVDEITLLSEILLEFGGTESETDLNSRCTQWCMKAATLMREVLRECQKKIEKHGFRGILHFVMRDDIEKSLRSLEGAKSLLSLAHLALLAHRTRSPRKDPPHSSPPVEGSDTPVTRQPPSPRSRQSRDPIMKVSLPTWLGGKVWEFYSASAQNQWNITLETYAVLPADSPVFKYVRKRDVGSLRNLLRETPSLIFSRNPEGEPLLMKIATIFSATEIVSLILNEARSPSSEDIWDALHGMASMAFYTPRDNLHGLRETSRLLLHECEDRLIGNDFNDEKDWLPYFSPIPDLQQQILQATYPPIHEQPESLRIDLCAEFLFREFFIGPWFDPESTIFAILGSINPTEWKNRLPFILAICVAMGVYDTYSSATKVYQTIGEAVSLGVDFAILGKAGMWSWKLTPMLLFLMKYCLLEDWNKHIPLLRHEAKLPPGPRIEPSLVLHAWAQVLLNAGVDLIAYGKQERSLHSEELLFRRGLGMCQIYWFYVRPSPGGLEGIFIEPAG